MKLLVLVDVKWLCCLCLLKISFAFALPVFDPWKNPWLKDNPWVGKTLKRHPNPDDLGKVVVVTK